MAPMAIDFTLSPELEHIRLRVRTFVDEVVSRVSDNTEHFDVAPLLGE